MTRVCAAAAIAARKPFRWLSVYSFHFEKSMNARACATSLWIFHESGGTFEYQGQCVFAEWQFWQARVKIDCTGEGTCEPPNRGLCPAGVFGKLFHVVSATARTVPTVTALMAAFKSVA